MFNITKGDLFTSKADVLAHGCNTFGVMGSGIAVAFRNRWPEMFKQYAFHCKQGDEKLWATSWFWENPNGKPNIACLFTQHGWNAEPTYIEYAMLDLISQMGNKGSVAFPAIGCGIAKTAEMNEDVLIKICNQVFGKSGVNATLYLPRE